MLCCVCLYVFVCVRVRALSGLTCMGQFINQTSKCGEERCAIAMMAVAKLVLRVVVVAVLVDAHQTPGMHLGHIHSGVCVVWGSSMPYSNEQQIECMTEWRRLTKKCTHDSEHTPPLAWVILLMVMLRARRCMFCGHRRMRINECTCTYINIPTPSPPRPIPISILLRRHFLCIVGVVFGAAVVAW